MGQSAPGNSPDVGRPRGAVWRTLVGEGIVWEGQATIAGEHADLDVRLIVTGQRIVFVRNGAIALDAQRDWLDPAPTMGRNGRVTLTITTPAGNGPIPVEIRVRDGKFGAARLLARLDDRPVGSRSPAAPPSPRAAGRERGNSQPAVEQTPRADTDRPSSDQRPDRTARPASHAGMRPPAGSKSRPDPSPARTEPPTGPAFGIPAGGLPSSAMPMPSFGVAAPVTPPGYDSRRPDSGVSARPAGDSPTPVSESPALSVEAVNRAFGNRSAPASPAGAPAEATVAPDLPESPTRWTLASELLARSEPSATPGPPTASPAGSVVSAASLAQQRAAAAPVDTDTTTPQSAPAFGPVSPQAPADSSSRAVPMSTRRADPVPDARPAESPGTRRMLPGLPADPSLADPASDREPASAAPSGRRAGNSVITARSSAAARQSAKQAGGPLTLAAGEALPTAAALASARAGVPLAPTPDQVSVREVPVLGDEEGGGARRGRLTRGTSARVFWGATAFLLVAMTLASGLYLALGIPDDGGNGTRQVGLAEPTVSGSGAIAATPTATRSVSSGVGGNGISDMIPTRAGSDFSAPDDDGPGDPAVGSSETATATVTATVTATTEPPTATTVPPTATAEPTATVELPTPTSEPPTATAVPPTATAIPPAATAIPPTATAIPPTATAVPPTATATEVPPTATATAVPPTATATAVPPTATAVPPTATATAVPPTATVIPPTATAVPPTATAVPPTATVAPPTATPTAIPPTATAVPPTATATDAPPTAEPEAVIAGLPSDAASATSAPSSAPTVTSAPTTDPDGATVPNAQPSLESAGPSGPQETVEPTVGATATTEPTATDSPTATAEPTVEPTIELTATPEPTIEPTATNAPPATLEPTATIEPTEATALTATTAPTATTEPTATTGPTVFPEPAIEPQPSTVPDEGVPSQAFTTGSVRYTIESVAAGETIPEINQPSSPFSGDWLAVVVSAENWGEGDAVIDMTQFTVSVGSNGETRRLDSFSETVSIQLGFPAVVGATEEVVLEPDQSIRLGLLFLTAEDASGFVLNAGPTAVDLTEAIDTSPPMDELDEAPSAPDLLEATVVGVIDPVTIEVDIDGEVIPVRYTGTTAPDGESCSFDQSLDANRDLVMGQTVWLERQNTNADADGAWLRDVWIEGEDGSLALVSGLLVAQGMIDVAIQEPDSRYAGYLEALASGAEEDGLGLWAGC